MATLQQLFDRPDRYLFAFEGDDAVFVDMDRDAYARSIFLDRRLSRRSATSERIACATLFAEQARLARHPPGVAMIFHIAHCGSTLLARALDLREATLVYREPLTLRQLGIQAGGSFYGTPAPAEWQRRLQLAWTLLNRRYHAHAPAIVKANVPVNFMLSELMALQPDRPAILLYYSLENYLLAVLRSAEHMAWVENVSRDLQQGIDALAGPREAGQSPAVIAARLWLAQMRLFDAALERFPGAMSLNADTLFDDPKSVVAAAFAHFGAPQADPVVDAIAQGELFARYSKNPAVAFDNAQRLQRQSELRARLQGELQQAHAWIAAQHGIRLPRRLAKPLAGAGCDLLWD